VSSKSRFQPPKPRLKPKGVEMTDADAMVIAQDMIRVSMAELERGQDPSGAVMLQVMQPMFAKFGNTRDEMVQHLGMVALAMASWTGIFIVAAEKFSELSRDEFFALVNDHVMESQFNPPE
jgi:hypothetical protein